MRNAERHWYQQVGATRVSTSPGVALGALVVAGLILGALLWLLVDALSHWPPDRPWGNGALIIPFSFGPSLIAGGWVAAAAWLLRDAGWIGASGTAVLMTVSL